MKKRITIFYIGLLLLVLGGCGKPDTLYLDTESAVKETEAAPDFVSAAPTPDTESALCYVYVCGAVGSPGVYPLPFGSRVYEAIAAAGGLLEEAGADCINQAQPVADGQMINVLTAEEAKNQPADAAQEQTRTEASADGRVNINTAAAAELMTLPGIGESKAESIISYRDANGGFDKIEDIMNITGIKEGVFLKLKEDITVD